jgi:hypothetical protein
MEKIGVIRNRVLVIKKLTTDLDILAGMLI